MAEHSQESIFVHAGVVGWRGHAILFPGRSWSGKSTIVRALLRLGAVYFSDEFAVLDSNGLVHPFARPLSLRLRSRKMILRPTQIGAEVGSQPLRASAVVLTHYAPNGVWRPVLVSPGQAIMRVLRNTVAVRSQPLRSIEYVKRLVFSGLAIHSARGEADTTAPLILGTLNELQTKEKTSGAELNAAFKLLPARPRC